MCVLTLRGAGEGGRGDMMFTRGLKVQGRLRMLSLSSSSSSSSGGFTGPVSAGASSRESDILRNARCMSILLLLFNFSCHC